MSERELVDQCIQGNREACKSLYETYGGRLYGICLRYIGSRESAEDVFHDGYMHILDVLPKFKWKGEGSLKAWLDRVIVNFALQHLRKRKVILYSDDLIENEEDQNLEPEESLNDIPKSILMNFISELPNGYRTVFNLYVFEEKSHKEIAQLLKINEKSSSSQLFRAKKILATKIKDYINGQ